MPEYETKQVFAGNLARLLAESGQTQADLVRVLGVSKSTVSSWVCGEKMPRMDKLEQMARHFGTAKAALLEQAPPGFDDFTYAMHQEAGTLSAESRQKLLEMARFFNELQQKEGR